jgi:hypothetical protein
MQKRKQKAAKEPEFSRNNLENIQKNSEKLRRQHSGKMSFPLQMPSKDTRLQILQDPINSAL